MRTAVITRDLLVAQTRALKRPGVARVFASLARQARDAHWPHEDYLHEVLTAEQASRHESVIRQRLREARFPEVKTLDAFDFTAADSISATPIHAGRRTWPSPLASKRPSRNGACSSRAPPISSVSFWKPATLVS
jgi:DNA replication protein DnaC